MRLTTKTILTLGLLAGLTTIAVGQADAIKTRQAAMKAIGGSMGSLVKMIKGEAPFDAAVAKAAVATIGEKAKDFDTLFPAGSDKGETEAKATIWSDTAGFKAALAKLQAAAKDNAETVGGSVDTVKATVGALGATCKGCHDGYREKKS